MNKNVYDVLFKGLADAKQGAIWVECGKDEYNAAQKEDRYFTSTGDTKYFRIIRDLDEYDLVNLHVAKQTKLLLSIEKTMRFFYSLTIIGLAVGGLAAITWAMMTFM